MVHIRGMELTHRHDYLNRKYINIIPSIVMHVDTIAMAINNLNTCFPVLR
mgnify:CR=1 FL=1